MGIGRRLTKALPSRITARLAPIYNKVRAREAKEVFRNRSIQDRTASPDAPDHVVVVVVDGLRYDYLQSTRRRLNLDLYEGVTAATWTFPSVTSILTGQYPHEHGAMRNSDDLNRKRSEGIVLPRRVDGDVPTLSSVFAGAGYRTTGWFSFYMPFHALFGQFEDNVLYNEADGERVLQEHQEWLTEYEGDRTFSYLHLGDLHQPVDPPEAYWNFHNIDKTIPDIRAWAYTDTADVSEDGERYRRHRRRLYLAALEYVLYELERYQSALEELGSDVVVVITSDHGEALWENASFDEATFRDTRPAYGVGHGGTPYESVAKVPILTNVDVGAVQEPVSTVDLAPTLVEAAGIDPPLTTTGTEFMECDGTIHPLIEASRYGYEKKATYERNYKLLVSKGDEVTVGFILPDETKTELPDDVTRRMADRLPTMPDGSHTGSVAEPEVQRRLRNLGYK